MSDFGTFFHDIKADETIVFTTFTLDEAVLVALLDANDISRKQPTVVFHDIMRHRNPGLLKSEFVNSIVYTVELADNDHQRCPVFHSKIWARVASKRLKRIAITSANLSQYHVVARQNGGTLESFYCINESPIKLPAGCNIFNEKFLVPKESWLKKGLMRIKKLAPYSLVIDTRAGLAVRATREPLIEEIKKLGTPKACAGPFVCDQAIKRNLQAPTTFKIYEGTNRKTGLALHAKVMTFPKCLALGSVNWTDQAMGCSGVPVNHETLLITQMNKTISNALRDFPSRSIADVEEDRPADEDPEDRIGENWREERQLRINAPEQALLNIRNNRASIALVGEFYTVTVVRLQSAQVTEKVLDVRLRNDTIHEPRNAQHARVFAEILATGNVVLIGLNRGKEKWKTELNYQAYRLMGEEMMKKKAAKGRQGKRRHKPEMDNIAYPDVRDIRQGVINSLDKAYASVAFNRWLHQHKVISTPIPKWCLRVAAQLAEAV